MPKEWTELLTRSNISKQEQVENPQAVLDVLHYFETKNKTSFKYMTTNPNDGNIYFIQYFFQNINVLFSKKNFSKKQFYYPNT